MKRTQVGRVISHQPVTGVSYRTLHNAEIMEEKRKRGRPRKQPEILEAKPVYDDSFEMRDYQKKCSDAVIGAYESGQDRALIVLATGSGKTVIASDITRRMLKRYGKKTLFLAHRGELLSQAGDKLKRFADLDSSLEKADSKASESEAPVILGSVQTMMRDRRLESYPPDTFSFIVVDEAHHAVSDSYQKILNHFSGAKVLGMTATPDRMDKRQIEGYFNPAVFEYPMKQGIKEEHLSPIRARMIPLELDISGVAIKNGDFELSGLDTALNPYLGQIAKKMKKYCSDRKTIVFLPLVSTARRFSEILNRPENGFRSASIDGSTPLNERNRIYADLKNGKINVICNAMVLTEGFDENSVDCIICLRPTKSRALYTQIVGRGTRTREGKEYCLLLDFLWLSKKHDLCRPSSLVAPDEEIAEKLNKRIADGELVDLIEAEEQEEEDRRKTTERRLREELERRAAEEAEAARKKEEQENERLFDPLLFAVAVGSDELMTYSPAWPWEKDPVTAKQKDTLKAKGINPNRIRTKGQASVLLKELFRRQDAGLATAKQIRYLEDAGFTNVSEWSFEKAKKQTDILISMPTEKQITTLMNCGFAIPWEWPRAKAKEILDLLAANRWKRPEDFPYYWCPDDVPHPGKDDPASDVMLSLLERTGHRIKDGLTYFKGESTLNEDLGNVRYNGEQPVSDGQMEILWRYGFGVPWEWTRAEAREVIGELRANKWRVPDKYLGNGKWRPERIPRQIDGRVPMSEKMTKILESHDYRLSEKWRYNDGAKILAAMAEGKTLEKGNI